MEQEEQMRARPTNLPSANLRPVSKDKSGGGWLSLFGLIVAILFIGLLCFWSMTPTPFNAPRTMNGEWEGVALATDADDEERHVSVVFNIANQIRPSIEGEYRVGPTNDDGSVVMIGDRELKGPLTFSQIQIKGVMWSASAPCGDEGEICAFAVRKGEALLTIIEKEGGNGGVSRDYALRKVGFSNSVFSEEGGQHKIRYGLVIFVVVVFLKVLVSKMQSPSEKKYKALTRRRRNYKL